MMPDKLNKKQKKEYVDQGGVKCPYCGSDDIDVSNRNEEDTEIRDGVRCLSCDKEWTDVYKIVQIIEEDAAPNRKTFHARRVLCPVKHCVYNRQGCRNPSNKQKPLNCLGVLYQRDISWTVTEIGTAP